MMLPQIPPKLHCKISWTILPALCLLLFIAVITFQQPFLCVLIPEKFQTPEKLSTLTPKQSCLILENAQLYYTGYDCIKNGRLTGQYFYALTQENCYFFLLSPRKDASRTSPLLLSNLHLKVDATNTQYHNLRTSFSQDIQWSALHLSEISPDYLLVENQGEYIYTLLFALILFLLSLWLMKTFFTSISTFAKEKQTEVL